jgi:hypothetical protein
MTDGGGQAISAMGTWTTEYMAGMLHLAVDIADVEPVVLGWCLPVHDLCEAQH